MCIMKKRMHTPKIANSVGTTQLESVSILEDEADDRESIFQRERAQEPKFGSALLFRPNTEMGIYVSKVFMALLSQKSQIPFLFIKLQRSFLFAFLMHKQRRHPMVL